LLTPKESEIVAFLRRMEVARVKDIADTVRVSRRTVRRALRKVGHYSSINQNSTWVTLGDTPQFGADGLWFHGKVCFSSHGGLRDTVRALIQASEEGCTVVELERRLRTRVHQCLSALASMREVAGFYQGRNVVYRSASEEVGSLQEERRRARQEAERRASLAAERDAGRLPAGLDALVIIRLLAQMILTPEASVASLSKTLQAHKVEIDADTIRQVIDFYDLQKKTEL